MISAPNMLAIANIRVTTKTWRNHSFTAQRFNNNKNSALAALQIQDKGRYEQTSCPISFVTRYPTPYFNFKRYWRILRPEPVPGVQERRGFFAAYERNYARSPVNIFNNKLPQSSVLGEGDFSLETSNPTLLPDVPASVTLTPAEKAADTYQGRRPTVFVTIPSRLPQSGRAKAQSIHTFPKISTAVGP